MIRKFLTLKLVVSLLVFQHRSEQNSLLCCVTTLPLTKKDCWCTNRWPTSTLCSNLKHRALRIYYSCCAKKQCSHQNKNRGRSCRLPVSINYHSQLFKTYLQEI